jgi:uncharacterized OsmC-like protein
MDTITAQHDGAMRFSVTYVPSGTTVKTDPPAGHGGEGTTFAPTDLLVAALVTCTGTTIVAKAQSMGLDASGIKMSASHTMADAPRRIAAIEMTADMPRNVEERQKKSLIASTRACTVGNSLRADIKVTLTLRWPDGSSDIVER